jgi:hypothetical protein
MWENFPQSYFCRRRTDMKNFVAAGALGCALLLAPIAYGPAQAMHGGHMGAGGHMSAGGHPSMVFHSHPSVFHSRPFFAHNAHPFFFRHHHRFRHFAFIGYPYYDTDYYGGDCGWLYSRAIYSGSRYWWYRYYQCTGY